MFKKIRFFGERSVSSLIHKIFVVGAVILSIAMLSYIMIWPSIGSKILIRDTGEVAVSKGLRLFLLGEQNIQIASDYYLKSTLYEAPSRVLDIIGLCYMASIFKNFSLNKIFTLENFKNLRDFGVVIIISSILYDVGSYFATLELNKVIIEGAKVVPEFSLISGAYLLGITIIIFAEVFRRAIIMKEEQELTV